jgi:hypothetical protein
VSDIKDGRVISAFSGQHNALPYMLGVEQRITEMDNDISTIESEYVKKVFTSVSYGGYLSTTNNPNFALLSLLTLSITTNTTPNKRCFVYFHAPTAYVSTTGWGEIGIQLNDGVIQTMARVESTSSSIRFPVSFFAVYRVVPEILTVKFYIKSSGTGVTFYVGTGTNDSRLATAFFQL